MTIRTWTLALFGIRKRTLNVLVVIFFGTLWHYLAINNHLSITQLMNEGGGVRGAGWAGGGRARGRGADLALDH